MLFPLSMMNCSSIEEREREREGKRGKERLCKTTYCSRGSFSLHFIA